jgi:hypothetical protein
VYPGNLRDIAFSVSRDGGRSFAAPLRVSEDQWALEGCPDDGPAMAVDAQHHIHIVWPTLVNDAPADRAHAPEPAMALFYAMSADGRRFTPRQRIPTDGMPHHPQMASAPDGALAIAWDEGVNGTRRAVAARAAMDAAGRPRFARVVLAERAVYPVVAATSDGTVVAWTSAAAGGSVIRVERR